MKVRGKEYPVYQAREVNYLTGFRTRFSVPALPLEVEVRKRMMEHIAETIDLEEFRRFLDSEPQDTEKTRLATLREQLAQANASMQEIEETISHLKRADLIATQEEKYGKLVEQKERLEVAINTPQPEKKAVTVWKLRNDIARLAYDPMAFYKSPLDHQKRLIGALTTKLDLSLVAPRWMQLDVEWFFPAWGKETLYLYRRLSPPVRWTPEETAWLKEHYCTDSRDDICRHFSNRSWDAIKNYARDTFAYKRSYADRERGEIDCTWSYDDWHFLDTHPQVLDMMQEEDLAASIAAYWLG
jgi:hypothetical protein